MFRTSLALCALAMVAAPASAGSYSARPMTPANGKLITRDIVWNCGPAACQGSTQDSRPAVLCQSLAKRTGLIESFLVDGRAFSAAELDRCNASAKPQPTQALAAQ
jgi:hypothetical protein